MSLLGLVCFFAACAPDREVAPLGLVLTEPSAGQPLAADGVIRVRFDAYLDPTQRWGSGATLVSGEQKVGFSAGYDPVDRALVIVPNLDLRVGLAYVFTLEAETIRTLDGRVFSAPITLEFVAGPPTGQHPLRAPVDFEAELREPFARRCGCHGPEPFDWPPLMPEALINVPSKRDPDRMLVVPGEPMRSELVLKLLAEYPGVAADRMPPEAPLEAETIRRVVAWVEQLPRR